MAHTINSINFNDVSVRCNLYLNQLGGGGGVTDCGPYVPKGTCVQYCLRLIGGVSDHSNIPLNIYVNYNVVGLILHPISTSSYSGI